MYEIEPPAESPDQLAADAAPADPYDGVPLGVECAWPAEFQL